MDDLVHHILRELSFDGDLGCSVSRLVDFIKGFYEKTDAQTVDDAYCAFIWSVIVQEPTVRVGVLPPGEHTEVYVPPQTSAQRKAKKNGEDIVVEPVTTLSIVLDAALRSLDDLKAEYGETLRIAVDPETSFAAITGSHIRPSKLTPMVYCALQLVTRGRDRGISVVELGRKTRYDQKTCFYVVQQLERMELIVKIRQAGVGTHFCMHKHFYERSEFWKGVRDEEATEKAAAQQEDEKPDEPVVEPSESIRFDPIDSRHLSSLPLVRGRLLKLLNKCSNHMHVSQNLLVTLGFENPTKTDRRFFSVRLAELVKEGTIEKVLVPYHNSKRPQTGSGKVQCVRLVSKSTKGDDEKDEVVVLSAETMVEDDDDAQEDGAVSQETFHLKTNVVFHRQIIDLLHNSGTRGMTLSELSYQLCNFDRRTVELLLQRLDKDPPPPHLLDLGVAVVTETYGRERRHRYYTYQAYKTLLEREHLDDAGPYSSVDLSKAGDFLPVGKEEFWETVAELHKYQDDFRDEDNKQKGKKNKTTNPILADGSVKKGRPRKDSSNRAAKKETVGAETKGGRKRKGKELEEPAEFEGSEEPPSKKRKADVPIIAEPVATTPRKRGRPRKVPVEVPEEKVTATPRKRGRPPKQRPINPSPAAEEILQDSLATRDASMVDVELPKPPPLIPTPEQNAVSLPPFETELFPDTSEVVFHFTPNPVSPEVPMDTSDLPANSTNPVDYQASITQQPEPEGSSLDLATQKSVSEPVGEVQDIEMFDPVPRQPVITPENKNIAKRHLSNPTIEEPSAKRLKSQKGKTNVSHLRREHELFRVIQEFGGITVINVKEFLDAHIALLETLTNAEQSTSSPMGTRLDRRTVDTALQRLESDCRIKVIKTSLRTPTGSSRTMVIAHLPDMEQDKIKEYISGLNKHNAFGYFPPRIKNVEEGVEYNQDGSKITRSAPKVSLLKVLQSENAGKGNNERWAKNVPRAAQLFSYDDIAIRDILRQETTTISQTYGYMTGRVARARKLHLLGLEHLQKGADCPETVFRDQRVFHLTYFLRNITVSDYCSLVSTISHVEALEELLKTEEGRKTQLSELPTEITLALNLGVSRSRSRILDLLQLLYFLDLVTPLQPSKSDTPLIKCYPNGTEPTAFDVQSSQLSFTNSAIAPIYWKFNDTASLRLWGNTAAKAPLWKEVSLLSHDNGVVYWDDLRSACFDQGFISAQTFTEAVAVKPQEETDSLGRSLRREAGWKTSYSLSWYQERYIRQFTNPNPLLDEDGGDARIKHIAWTVGAPATVIQEYYAAANERLTRELEKALRRSERKKKPVKVAEDKKSLAKKAAERKARRQQDWDTLLARLHPDPVKKPLSARLKPIRDDFLKAASVRDSQKWEDEINDLIRETQLVISKKLAATRPPVTPAAPVVPSHIPLTIIHTSERSVDELIAQQGPSQKAPPPKKRKSEKSKNEDLEPKKRRGRFSWNKEYDELAKDTCAVIKARCRSGQRMEWAAAEQAFPGLPRNSVRQRVERLSKDPAVEAYLRRLEDRWYDLWMQQKGTPLLPDSEPTSVSNFDLVKHLKFLRTHVDKVSLRAGFSQAQVQLNLQLPSTVEHLLATCEVIEKSTAAPPWDFVWNATTEEGREKQMFSQAFVIDEETVVPEPIYDVDSFYVAEAAVKMVLGTPHDSYDFASGASLLQRLGEESVSVATVELINRGVLTKLVRDPQKAKPGRTLKISEMNLNAIGGYISREIFQDASSLEELSMEEQSIEDDDRRSWPLLASDGDMAALVEMVSDDKVDFDIDTSQARSARLAIEWNSKKADDDDIETDIRIQIRDLAWIDMWPMPGSSSHLHPEFSQPLLSESLVHGLTLSGEPACCSKTVSGPVDCQACVEKQFAQFLSSLGQAEKEVARSLFDTVKNAGPKGVAKNELLSRINPPQGGEIIFALVDKMTRISIPIVYWTGYVDVVLVSSLHIQPWTVAVTDDPPKRVFPKRWIDIKGIKLADVWEAALRAVVGIIIFRPGITQSELRWRLRTVYDRAELNDLAQYLESESFIVRRVDTELCHIHRGPLDDQEEKQTFWFLGVRHWYHV